MTVINPYSLNPNTGEGTNQVAFNNSIKNFITDLNTYADGGNNRVSYYNDNRQTPVSTPISLTAKTGKNQYIGVISSASPGALNFELPLPANLTAMDSFFFVDESINANTYTITITCTGAAKIYGKGLSASGVTSITITDAGGYKELLYITTNKFQLIRNSV